jgi:pyruvate formate lyase activating enzyme
VFVKGCPLHCLWCQNPESISFRQEIWFEPQKCIGCLSCIVSCQSGALTAHDTGVQVRHEKCTACELCVKVCPSGALQCAGQEWTMDGLVREVLKDKRYYDESGGGVTVSGGEPLAHASFVRGFFKTLQDAGVHTALDTSGAASSESLFSILPYTNMVLYDVKLLDSKMHEQYTGCGNQRILGNLKELAQYLRGVQAGEKRDIVLWVRTPLVPDVTATTENIAAIAGFIHDNLLDIVSRWELCTFNFLCESKYRRLGKTWHYQDDAFQASPFIRELVEAAFAKGIPGDMLTITGMKKEMEGDLVEAT